MEKTQAKRYSPTEYAELKGVVAGRISQLKPKLIKEEIGKHWFIIDCAENDALFSKPSHNSNRG